MLNLKEIWIVKFSIYQKSLRKYAERRVQLPMQQYSI